MSSTFKFVLILGVTGVGLFLCGKVFVNQPGGEHGQWGLLDEKGSSLDDLGFEFQARPEFPPVAMETHGTDFIDADTRHDLAGGFDSELDLTLNIESSGQPEPALEFAHDNDSTGRTWRLPDPAMEAASFGPNATRVANPFIGEEQPIQNVAAHQTGNEFVNSGNNVGDALAIENMPMANSIQQRVQMAQPQISNANGEKLASSINQQIQENASGTVSQVSALEFQPEPTRQQMRQPIRRQPVMMTAPPVVEERAMQHINYGKSLARRGAVFAARQEFIQALRLIADAHDMTTRTRDYTRKLAAAFQALEESDDFVAVNSEEQLQMDVTTILETHSSRIFHPNLGHDLSPIKAMQTYYGFATEQMVEAVGRSPVASEALHSLGRLLTTASQFDASGKPLDPTKAMVMHHVALSANPNNHLSANELGVLMARNGRWQQAADLFGQSLRSRRMPTTWTNLAKAHHQLAQLATDDGQRNQQLELASLAENEARMVASTGTTAPAMPVNWASPNEFDHSAAMPAVMPNGQPVPPAIQQQGAARTAEKPEGNRLMNAVKKLF